MDLTKLVEEERRLLYVGVTRSKEKLFVDIPENKSPLLDEIEYDDYKKYNQIG